MASLMDDLMNTLKQEDEEYKKLVAVAQEKTDAIIKADIEQLRKITEEEQTIMARIFPLEKKREENAKDIATVLNRPAEILTVSYLLELMDKQPDVRERLGGIHDSLKDTVNQLARINDINQGLLKEALDLVNFDINIMNSLRQAPLTADYDKSAYNTDSRMLRRGGFDKTQ